MTALLWLLPFWCVAATLALWWWWNAELSRTAFRRIVGAATLAYAALAFAPPVLSDDLYRYAWEGAVLRAGYNPFVIPPQDVRLDAVEAALPGVRDRINSPAIPAIYPPPSQAIFAALVWGPYPLAMLKLGFCAAVFAAVWALRAAGTPRARLAVILWHPLLVLEVALAGHLDALALLGCAILVLGIKRGAGVTGAVGIFIAAGAKLAPIIWLPCLWSVPASRAKRLFLMAAIPALLGASYLPFFTQQATPFAALTTYGRVWEFNGGAFPILRGGFAGMVGGQTSAPPFLDGIAQTEHFEPQRLADVLARLALKGLFLAAVLTVWWRGVRGEALASALWFALLVCSPVVHPWYLLPGLVFTARGGRLAPLWAWWCGTIPLNAFMLPAWWEAGVWAQPAWVWWLQYGGLAACGALVYIFFSDVRSKFS